MYNFSGTKAATANSYLNPGIYRLKVTEVKQDKFAKGTVYIGFKFENEDGVSFIEKFTFATEKGIEVTMSRLQYLHEGFFGKPLTKNFSSIEELLRLSWWVVMKVEQQFLLAFLTLDSSLMKIQTSNLVNSNQDQRNTKGLSERIILLAKYLINQTVF